MNKVRNILILIAVCIASGAIAQTSNGWLMIRSGPMYRFAMVDSFRVPVPASLQIPAGIHQIRFFTTDSLAWESPLESVEVKIQNHDTTVVVFPPDSVCLFQSMPEGADVLISGKEIGQTPLLVKRFPQNPYIIGTAGYFADTLTASGFSAGGNILRLRPDPARSGELFLNRPVITNNRTTILVAGATIATGILAVMWKQKANDLFDEYARTRSQVTLDRTHRYDLMSGIALGVTQAGIAALIGLILSDR